MTQNSKIITFMGLFALCLCISACVKTEESRGYTLEQADFDHVQLHQSHKEDILGLLGSPSSKSLFGTETWYYITAKTESVAFFTPKVKQQHVVAISFDNNDLVTKVANYDLSDANKVDLAKDTTNAPGHSTGVIQDLFGNVGRFNPEGLAPRTTSHGGGMN